MGESEPQGTVAPTGWQAVVAAVLIGAIIGWLLFAVPEMLSWPLPQLPLVVAVTIAVIAAAIAVQAVLTHRSIQVRRESVPASRAVMLLVLGKTCLLAGAGIASGYAAILVYFLPRLSAELPKQRVVSSAAAVLASIGLAIAGHFLERSCRIPGPPSGDATPGNVPGSQSTPD